MEDHQGDGTRIFETHLPCRAFLRDPHNSAACEEQNDNTSESTLKRNLWDLPFEAVCLKGSGGRHCQHS